MTKMLLKQFFLVILLAIWICDSKDDSLDLTFDYTIRYYQTINYPIMKSYFNNYISRPNLDIIRCLRYCNRFYTNCITLQFKLEENRFRCSWYFALPELLENSTISSENSTIYSKNCNAIFKKFFLIF